MPRTERISVEVVHENFFGKFGQYELVYQQISSH